MLLTFHIQLEYITNPEVWRRVAVPAEFSFQKFHYVIQAAFGWQNAHLYQFVDKVDEASVFIGEPYEEDMQPVTNSREIKLSQVFTKVHQKFIYNYDFGDDWNHHIVLEKIEDLKAGKAKCLAGEGACPPEDCGGPPGYEDLKEILADPEHEEHEEMKEWLGLKKKERWDANKFSLQKTNKILARI